MKNIKLPSKSQLIRNFSSCIDWESKYMYLIDLGKLLPKFPEKMRIQKYFITDCQSQTWILLLYIKKNKNNNNGMIQFYGDSDAAIVKGIIAVIFTLYQNINIQSIINFDIIFTLNQLQFTQNLTSVRSQGIHAILRAIRYQASNLLKISN